MKLQTAYCSAHDAQVRITWTAGPTHIGQANLPDGPEIVCLEFGERCTGELCPMLGQPRILMGVRLARSELAPASLRSVRGPCPGCGEVADLKILDAQHVFCPACGNTSRWIHLEVGDDDYIALCGAS